MEYNIEVNKLSDDSYKIEIILSTNYPKLRKQMETVESDTYIMKSEIYEMYSFLDRLIFLLDEGFEITLPKFASHSIKCLRTFYNNVKEFQLINEFCFDEVKRLLQYFKQVKLEKTVDARDANKLVIKFNTSNKFKLPLSKFF